MGENFIIWAEGARRIKVTFDRTLLYFCVTCAAVKIAAWPITAGDKVHAILSSLSLTLHSTQNALDLHSAREKKKTSTGGAGAAAACVVIAPGDDQANFI